MRTFYSLWSFLAGIATSTISEGSSAAGVTVDSVLLKDGTVTTTGKIKMGSFEIHSGAGVPNGDLDGAVTTTRAIYLRTDGATADEVIYSTVNTGTNWAAAVLAS